MSNIVAVLQVMVSNFERDPEFPAILMELLKVLIVLSLSKTLKQINFKIFLFIYSLKNKI
jgi:hypothetical protein